MPTAPVPPHAWSVQTRLEPGPDSIRLTVSGRLGTEGAAQVRSALDVATAGGGRVQLDLSGVDYISSAGLAVLRAAAATLGDAGGALVIVEASEPVRLALKLAGDPVLPAAGQ